MRAVPAIMALAAALALAGCTTEHEVSEDELMQAMMSGGAFEVDGKPFSGRLVYREDDQVRMTMELDDGYPHGTTEVFHDNGKRASRTKLAWDEDEGDSVLDGEEIDWNEEGVMVQRRVARRGEVQRHERWCDNGDQKEKLGYEDGVRRTREEWSCETGNQISAEAFNSDNQRHGEQKTWSAEGTLIAHRIHVDGQYDGLQQEWHENGEPKLRGTYDNGAATGRHEAWDEAGTLVDGGDYDDNGAKTGLWLEGQLSGLGSTSSQVHYGPDGFIRPELAESFVRALIPGRPDADAVAFFLEEGQVSVDDALPADSNGRASANRFSFPARHWTYPVVVADPSMLQMLMDRGADINQADSHGSTRLLRCVDSFSAARNSRREGCSPDQLSALIELGASGGIRDLKQRTALHRILEISTNADRTMWGRPDANARAARIDAVAALARAGADPNAADAEGFTPLVRALQARRPDLVQALIAAGARADSAGPEDTMAVHWLFLTRTDRYDIDSAFVAEALPMLVAAGADVTAPMDWDGEQVTLRELAVRHALVDVVRALDASA